MKLVLCGKSFIACDALHYVHDLAQLFSLDFEILAVPNRTDTGNDTWEPSFKKLSGVLSVQLKTKIEDAELNAGDVLFSLEYDRIIKMKTLNNANAFNIHFSNLPKYRGCLTSVWPIRNKEAIAGVTLHKISEGVDDGDVVDQIIFDIPPSCTSYELYAMYHKYGYELFKRNIERVLASKIDARPQDEKLVSYYDRDSIDFKKIEMSDFNGNGNDIEHYIRSLMFEPYQMPKLGGRKIVKCDFLRAEGGSSALEVGDSIKSSPLSELVKCQDGFIRLVFDAKE